jgi:co-chaperonin GroES (HSP10)
MLTYKGKLTPIRDHVIVEEMDFGEQRTKTGLIISSDDGKAYGVKPRWARVHAVGNEQVDVKVNDWVLVSHGRWTRGLDFEDNGSVKTLRRVDIDAILLVSDEKPTDVVIGKEYSHGQSFDVRPEDFMKK